MGGKVRNMTVWKVLLFTVLLLYCFGADTADGDAALVTIKEKKVVICLLKCLS